MNLKRTIILILGVLIILCLIVNYTYSSSNTNKINVAYIPCDHEAALFVALAQNKYKENGLTVDTTSISTGSSIVSALASGDIDVGYVGIAPALQGISEGVPIKIVAAVNEDGSGIVVNPNSNITNTSDLVGKRIATPGVSTIQQVLLLYQLEKYNITANQVDISSVNIFMLPSTLASDKVDGYIAYEPYVSIAPYTNVGRVLMYSDEIMPGHPCCVIVARQDFIDNHPQELQTFLGIHKNSTEFVNDNINQTASLVSDELTTNPGLEKTALTHVVFVSQLNSDFQNRVLNFMNIELQMGYLKKNLTSSQIFDTSFSGD
ncbi:MAG: ABC transporter substrate-binding protein [Methanobacterium sp.]|nr:ABC transporter substrate-binding protein [Methanobacterium sp.]